MQNRTRNIGFYIGAVVLLIVIVIFVVVNAIKSNIVGTYTASVPLCECMSNADLQKLSELEDEGLGFIGDLTVDFTLTMSSVESYTLSTDAEALKSKMMDGFSAYSDSIIDHVMKLYGYSEYEYNSVAVNAGYNDFPAMKRDIISAMAIEAEPYLDSFQSAFDKLSSQGKYEVHGTTVEFTGTSPRGTAEAHIEGTDRFVMQVETETVQTEEGLIGNAGRTLTVTFIKTGESETETKEADE